MANYNSPGYRRMVARDQAKYEDLITDTLRQQQAALDAVREPQKKDRRKPRRDKEYPPHDKQGT